MILKSIGLIGALTGALLTSAPTMADVMEGDGEGARGAAGGPTMAAAAPIAVEEAGTVQLSASFTVPPESIADAAREIGLVPAEYVAKVHELSARFDLSPALIEAVVWQESRWRADAISPVGARGLAQLMPGTARELGVNPDDPFANLEGGARYLREQLDRFDGDLEKALAAYNAGPGRVMRAGGVPRIRETQEYVAAIMGRLSNHSRSTS